MTFDLTSDQLAAKLADQAFKEIEAQIHAKLLERVQPVIDEAAREVAKMIRPVVLKMHRNLGDDQVMVTLVLNNEPEKAS